MNTRAPQTIQTARSLVRALVVIAPSSRTLGAMASALVVPVAASAQTPCPQAAEADALEAEGQRLNLAHDYGAALSRYERAFALCGGARAQGRTAITHIALGRWVEADRWMRDTLARSTDPWVDGNRARLLAQAQIIAAHIGELLVVGAGPAGVVRVDGVQVASFPMSSSVRVSVGEATLRVEGRDRPPIERRVVITAGQTTRLELPAPPENTTRTLPPSPPREPPRQPLRWVIAGGAAGLGALGLGIGVWATFEAFDRRAAYDAACVAHQWNPAREADCGSAGRLLTRVWDHDVLIPQVAGFVAGGLLAAASIVLFATMPSSRTRSGIAWACGPLGAAVSVGCAGRF